VFLFALLELKMQVIRARVVCKDEPCMVSFELWQQHVMLSSACEVLLLPASMSDVAEELSTKVADLVSLKVRSHWRPWTFS